MIVIRHKEKMINVPYYINKLLICLSLSKICSMTNIHICCLVLPNHSGLEPQLITKILQIFMLTWIDKYIVNNQSNPSPHFIEQMHRWFHY